MATGAAGALAGAGRSFPGVPRSSSSSTSTSRSSRSSIARPRVVERRKVPRGVIARVVNGKFRCQNSTVMPFRARTVGGDTHS